MKKGFGYTPDPGFTIAMSVSYRLWGNMDKIKVNIKGLPDNEIGTFYKDSWVAGIGMEYWIRNDFALKAGLKYVQSATKDRGLAPGTVDVDQWNPTAGFAYVLSDSTELNASAMFTYGPREEFHGQTFEMGHWSLILGARFRL